MTIRHLEIFSEICRQMSVTKAAEKLNMAQPAVSHALKELEEYYSTKLFERMNRRLYITPAGEQLLHYAASILGQFDEARDVLRDMDALTGIRLGTNVAYGTGRLPDTLSAFRKKYPDIPFYTFIHNSVEVEKKLLENTLDFGIIDFPSNQEMLKTQLLEKDPIAVVCTADYPIPDRITSGELSAYPLLVREQGSGSRRLAEHLITAGGGTANIVMESISTQSLIKACVNGFGVLVLSKSAIETCTEKSQLREIYITDTSLAREYYLVFHRSKYLTKSMKTFLDFFKENADSSFL